MKKINMNKYKTDIGEGKSIVYIYFKTFEWLDDNDKEMLKGHPIEGRVYRAVKSPMDDLYFVKLDDMVEGELPTNLAGIAVHGPEDSAKSFRSVIEEINNDNVTELDIVADDLRNIGKWIESDNEDFREFLKEDQVSQEKAEDIVRDMIKQLKGEEAPKEDSVKELKGVDPLLHEVLQEYAEYSYKKLHNFDEYLVGLSAEILTHPKLGKGANIYNALNNVETYASEGSRGGDIENLYKALDAITAELIRLKLND